MLKLYICKQCKSVRFVSKNNITCFSCNQPMVLSSTPYADFILLNPAEREAAIDETLDLLKEVHLSG